MKAPAIITTKQHNKYIEFTVDTTHDTAHSEYFRDTKRLQLSAVTLAIIMLVIGGTGLYSAHGKPWGIMLMIAFTVVAVAFLAVAAVIPKKVGSSQAIYNSSPLAPAIVAEINPRNVTLLALVNISIEDSMEPRYALVAQTAIDLPGHQKKVGEKIPCVAIGAQGAAFKNKQYWKQMNLLPIAWATPDKGVVSMARDAISEAQWRKLKRASDRVAEVRTSPNGLVPFDQ